jgi:hypothetical protein
MRFPSLSVSVSGCVPATLLLSVESDESEKQNIQNVNE